MMTKRHYQQFADLLRGLKGDCAELSTSQHGLVKHIAIELAYICHQDNPRFDLERFLTTCGYPQKGETHV